MNNIQIWDDREISTAKGRYLYLLNSQLYTCMCMESLKIRVKELYFELMNESKDIDIITIANILDEENAFIIAEFLHSFDHTEEEIDEILSHYYYDYSCMMDIYVSDTLKELGFYYSGSPFHFLEIRELSYNEFLEPGQNMIFPELLEGRGF